MAGDRAAESVANIEARAHYTNALAAAEKFGSASARAILENLHTKQGGVLLTLGEYDGAVAHYQKALELARDLDDRRLEMEVLVWLSSAYDYSHRGEPA